tara:strand:+ start:409 stop:1554 length:1146 start_codon:yes stop_codon:yes gene_type:complete
MDWKKFTGPAILAGLAILIYVAVRVSANMIYDKGDTVHPAFVQTSCCMGLLSILMCLGSIVWFAFALGTKTKKTVFLSEDPDNFQHSSVPLASDSQSTVVPSTIGEGPESDVREKIIITKSEGDTEQMAGFLIIAGSIAMFALMVLLGFIAVLMSLGPGLGFSGGTCNNTCESIWEGAVLSKWASLLLFPCGLIALARPWSWFRSGQDIRDPVVKVRVGIVAGIALIAVISFGGPALIVLLITGMAWLIDYQMEDVELKALKLDEANVLVLTISLPLILVAIIASVFEFGLSFVFGYFSIAGAVLIMIILTFLPLVVCVFVAALIMILSKLNLVGTDGDWGALDLIKSVYSDIFSDEDDAPESEHEFVSESEEGWWEGQSE